MNKSMRGKIAEKAVDEWLKGRMFEDDTKQMFKDYFCDGMVIADIAKKYDRTRQLIWLKLDRCPWAK